MEGVTDAQKKKIQKLIDAKQSGIDATKKSYKSSTIPTMRGTEEDKEQAKKLKEYQYGKQLLKRADKREKVNKKRDGGLTKINPQKQPGLAALKKKRPDVVAKMGYARKGTMVQARGCKIGRKKPTRIT